MPDPMPFHKLCLIGAESTGKSTLGAALAQALRSRGYWAQSTPEVLRLFCDRFGRLPIVSDEPLILATQKLSETMACRAWQARGGDDGFLISDSSPLLTAFTSLWYFGDSSLIREALAHQREYEHCYLTEPGLPWLADGIQRDGPEARTRFHNDLRSFLTSHHIVVEPVSLCYDAIAKGAYQATTMADQWLSRAGLRQGR